MSQELSAEANQSEMINQVRDLLKEDLNYSSIVENEDFLLRFLRAHKFDLEKTHTQLSKCLRLRKKWDFDNIFSWQEPEAAKYYRVTGVSPNPTKEGYLLSSTFFGKVDLLGLMKSLKHEDLVRAKVLQMESISKQMKEMAEKSGKKIEKNIIIADLNGLSSSILTAKIVKVLQEMSEIDQCCYPDNLEKIYIIRAPEIFNVLWKFLKGTLDQETQRKFNFLGNDWKDILLNEFGKENLLEEYGGVLKPEDLGMVEGNVPSELYIENSESFETENIPAGKDYCVVVDIPRKNTKLSWEFFLVKLDIGFSLWEADENDNLTKPIIPNIKYQGESAKGGSFVALYPCKLVLKWDNSYSWTRSKTLKYTYEVFEMASSDSDSDSDTSSLSK